MQDTVVGLPSRGLELTVLGLASVFAGLGLLWGLIAGLNAVFGSRPEERLKPDPGEPESGADDVAASDLDATLCAERERVAAIVAGALMANPASLPPEQPAAGPAAHALTASSWVTANRARVLAAWQPPRVVGRKE